MSSRTDHSLNFPHHLRLDYFPVQRWPCRQLHGPVASWYRKFVVLTGHINREDFAHWLQYGPGLVIEIHDRDRKLQNNTPTDKLLADGSESLPDALQQAVSLGEGERPFDPHGVAVADLSPICRGARLVRATVPVLPCAERDAMQAATDAAISGKPMHPGHYVAAGTTLELVVEMTYARDFTQHYTDEQLLVISGAMDAAAARKRGKKAQANGSLIPNGGLRLRLINSNALAPNLVNANTVNASLVNAANMQPPSSPLLPFVPTTPNLPGANAALLDRAAAANAAAAAAALKHAPPQRIDHRPFTRLVALCGPNHADWVESLRRIVVAANLKTLGKEKSVGL